VVKKHMAHIDIYRVVSACGNAGEPVYETIFHAASRGSPDRVHIRPRENGCEVEVHVPNEHAVYALGHIREVLATTSGEIEVYFEGEYTRTEV
jgi:hypothetical protein